MTPNEINQAIAKRLGYIPCPKTECTKHWQNPAGIECELPNFCEDLNEMRLAEQSLKPKQKWEFTLRLVTMQENSTLTQPEDWAKLTDFKFKAPGFFAAIFATSAQRAEAFLKTVGKWRE